MSLKYVTFKDGNGDNRRVAMEAGAAGTPTASAGTDYLSPAHVLIPSTVGGCSAARYINLSTTGQVVKGAAGQVYGWSIANLRAGAIHVKLYNKATAASDADTPVLTLSIAQGTRSDVTIPQGVAFAAGISVRASTGIADNDTGAPGTNEAVVNIIYK